MVVEDQDPSVALEDNQEKQEAEEENSDAEATDKAESKTVTETTLTELGRFKLFTHKVAQCAARSFCETYVRPLVINNPNPLPQTANQNQVIQSATIFDISVDNENKTEIILNPKQEEQVTSVQNQRRETEDESDRQAEVIQPNKKEHSIEDTVNLLQEKEIITVDKRKPSVSFDIAHILSYLPCQSMAASCDQKDGKSAKAPINLESKSGELSEIFDPDSGDQHQTEDDSGADKEGSSLPEEELRPEK